MVATRRAHRASTKPLQASPETTSPATMAAAGKKRKAAAVEKYTCFSCAGEKAARLFPDYNPSPDCDHLINTCKHCLKNWVESQINDANFKTGSVAGDEGQGPEGAKDEVWGVGCPQCKAIMRAVNVEAAVPKKIYTRFDALERKHIGDTTPYWRWCLAPDCRAGQIHVPKQPKADKPALKRRKQGVQKLHKEPTKPQQEGEPDIITCNSCSFRVCARCDRPMHEGETCTEYQARTKDRQDEENKSLKQIRKVSKPCPGCSKNIERNGGCPSMICSQCNKNFCWNCLQVFDSGYCRCHPRP